MRSLFYYLTFHILIVHKISEFVGLNMAMSIGSSVSVTHSKPRILHNLKDFISVIQDSTVHQL